MTSLNFVIGHGTFSILRNSKTSSIKICLNSIRTQFCRMVTSLNGGSMRSVWAMVSGYRRVWKTETVTWQTGQLSSFVMSITDIMLRRARLHLWQTYLAHCTIIMTFLFLLNALIAELRWPSSRRRESNSGRSLTDKETVSTRTINCHCKRLDKYDSYCISESFKETFVVAKDQMFGLLRLWYSTTDDTKHGKSDNHHVVIRTGDNKHGECDDGFFIDPFFDCLSLRSKALQSIKVCNIFILL